MTLHHHTKEHHGDDNDDSHNDCSGKHDEGDYSFWLDAGVTL